MLEIQTIKYVNGLWSLKMQLHRQNVNRIKMELRGNFSYNRLKERNPKRIVIITEQILNIVHAPTKVVLNFAYIIQKVLGYEVLIFVVPSNIALPNDLWHKASKMHSRKDFGNKFVQIPYKDTCFYGTQFEMNSANYEGYYRMFSMIHEWNPLFVFNMGVLNPVADYAKEFTTVAAMSMSIECPISEGNILIRVSKNSEVKEKEYLDQLEKDQKQLFIEERLPVIVDEDTTKVYTRAELELSEEQFLIAIVGNRLNLEINQEFAEMMKQIIKREPSAAFVMIGSCEKVKELLEDRLFEGKVYYLGYQKNLTAVYKVLDLYMNPKRSGGGFSSVMALTAGIPVITLPDCDVAYNVGRTFVVPDYKVMVDTVCRYAEDQVFYKEMKKCAGISIGRNTQDKMEQYIKNLLDKITAMIIEEGNSNDCI